MTTEFPNDWVEPYDLFISYCREDDKLQQITAIAQEIETGHADFAPTQPLKVFFDKAAIVTGELWQDKLQKGIRQSKVMLTVLSKAYFESYWCRREYEEFLAVERSRTYPGEALMPVYVLAPAELDQNVSAASRKWFDDLNQRNGVELQDFWSKGQQFLQELDVRQRLQALRVRATERADYGRQLAKVPRRIRPRNARFVGRVQEIRQLRQLLTRFEIAAVCAVKGIGGIGKSSLAREYAYCYRPEYLGGQFEVDLANVHTRQQLEEEIIALAKDKLNAPIDERSAHARQLQTAQAAFAAVGTQHRILLILDNVNEGDVGLVSALSQADSLPSAESTHIVVTTRAGMQQLGDMQAVTVERLSATEALDVLLQYREFSRDTEDEEYQRAMVDQLSPTELEAGVDESQWKAALSIVNRLGRHTLAVAMVGAYLGVRRSVSFVAFLIDMQHHGIGLALEHVGSDAAVQQLISHPQTLIADLFRETLNWLNQQSPLHLQILQWASLLPAETIPVSWLRALISEDERSVEHLQRQAFGGDPFTESLEVLSSLQLLTGANGRQMHRVLQEVISDHMAGEDRDAAQTLIDQLIQQRAFEINDRGHMIADDHHQLLAMMEYVRTRPICEPLALGLQAMVTPLMNEGKLSLAVEAVNAVHQFLASLSASDPDNAAAQRDLSVSYLKLGDVCVAQGDLAGAKRYFELGHAIDQRLATDPDIAAAQRDLSLSFERMGNVCVAQGELAGAKRYFAQSRDIAQRLAADPDNAAAQRDLSRSYSKLGDVCVARGDLVGAKRYFELGLTIDQRLAADPDNDAAQRDLSVSYLSLGDVCMAQGDLPGAKRYFEQNRDILQRLASSDPDNAAAQRDLSVWYERLGNVCVVQGDLVGAKRYFEQCRDILLRLATDPDNAAAQRDLSVSYLKLGDVCVAQGDLARAKRYFELGLTIDQRLAADPDNAAAQRDLCISFERLAKIAQQEGETKAAMELLQQELSIAERLLDKSPDSAEMMRFVAIVHLKLGQAYYEVDQSVAITHRAQCAALLNEMQRRGMHLSPSDQQLLEKLQPFLNREDDSDSPSDDT